MNRGMSKATFAEAEGVLVWFLGVLTELFCLALAARGLELGLLTPPGPGLDREVMAGASGS